MALDAGADLVFGHGTHTLQGVEVYRGKPILYALGHSAFDQPGYEKSTDGLVVRVTGQPTAVEGEDSVGPYPVYAVADLAGADLGLDLQWARWGGSSDANLTAAAGVPTVDGLGPIGEGSHKITENIVVDALPARLALFAELVASLTEPV